MKLLKIPPRRAQRTRARYRYAAALAGVCLMAACSPEASPEDTLKEVAAALENQSVTTVTLSGTEVRITSEDAMAVSSEPGGPIVVEDEPSPGPYSPRPFADFDPDGLQTRFEALECSDDLRPYVYARSLGGSGLLVSDGCQRFGVDEPHTTLLDGRELTPFTDFSAGVIDEAVQDLQLVIGSMTTRLELRWAEASSVWEVSTISAEAPFEEPCTAEATRLAGPVNAPGLLLEVCKTSQWSDESPFRLGDVKGDELMDAIDRFTESMKQHPDALGQAPGVIWVVSDEGRLMLDAPGAVDSETGLDLRVPLYGE